LKVFFPRAGSFFSSELPACWKKSVSESVHARFRVTVIFTGRFGVVAKNILTRIPGTRISTSLG
jgi:hypothetical protein